MATTVPPLICHPLPMWPEMGRAVGGVGALHRLRGNRLWDGRRCVSDTPGPGSPNTGCVCPRPACLPRRGPGTTGRAACPTLEPRPQGVSSGPGSKPDYLGSDVTPPSHANRYKRLSQPASSFVKRKKIKPLQASASETSCLFVLPGPVLATTAFRLGAPTRRGQLPSMVWPSPAALGSSCWMQDMPLEAASSGHTPSPLPHCSPSGQPSRPGCPAGLFPTECPDIQGICWEWPEPGTVGPALLGHRWAPTTGHLSSGLISHSASPL